MPRLQEMLSFHIIEHHKTNQPLLSWTYPTISDDNKTLLLTKLAQIKSQSFTYFRSKINWFYITNTEVSEPEKFTNLKMFSVVLIAKDFNPDKYESLGRILSKCYHKSGTPIELVKIYLSVYTTGICSTQENGALGTKSFDNTGFQHSTKVKELITTFGLEIILLYTSILLKKRVVLYHHSQETLLKWLPTVTALMLHRNPTNYLFPTMELNSECLSDLKNQKYFVAGFTDSGICSKTELFDLLVNLPALEISITPQAKESLTMTKTHKDIAIFMVQLAENPDLSEQQVINDITNKTKELLNYLKSLSAKQHSENVSITIDDIKTKNLHPAIENFLFNLAVAENLIVF